MRLVLLSCAVCAFLASCASTHPPQEGTSPRTSASAVEASYAVDQVAAPSARPLDPVALELWNDPAFKKRFTESFLAETDIEPRLTTAEREWMQAILEHLAADRVDRAVAELEKRRGPAASAVFEFTLAGLHFQRDELDRAAPLYLAAVEKHPKFRRAWRNLGLVQFRRGEFRDAARSLSRVVELGGGDAVTYGLLGYAFGELEDPLAAESAYRAAIVLDPATMDWRMGLARSLFRQQRFADAAALCATLLARDPSRADILLLQANAWIAMGRPLDAVANYELAAALGAATPESLAMQGDIYVNEGLSALAVDAYLRAIGAGPTVGLERVIRGAKVLAARGAFGEVETLLAGIDASGREPAAVERKELLRLRARVALAQGASDEEARVLEEIVALDPLDGDALILLGQHARRSGDIDRALFLFERAAQIEASEPDARVHQAQALVARGDYAAAVPHLRRAQTLRHRETVQTYLEQVERLARTR